MTHRKKPPSSLLPTEHTVLSFEGTAKDCGRAYGETQAERIEGFMCMETPPNKRRLTYAGRCWEELSHWRRPVVDFVKGIAEGSGRTLEEITLVLLHEEIGHAKKCTAFGATGAGTRTGEPIIGQNWDWSARLYPWSCLIRLRTNSMPATLTYAYPGLWASAGMNEHGLALVWTSGGLMPKVRPGVGIPTYALIPGILTCRDCHEVLALLKQTKIAGCFIFFLADAGGEVWVIEGLPEKFEAVRCEEVICRANHYECGQVRRWSKQRVPRATVKKNTASRGRRMAELVQEYRGSIDGQVAQALLTDHEVGPGLNICQHVQPKRPSLTLDSFYALPARREFHIARGLPCRHQFRKYKV